MLPVPVGEGDPPTAAALLLMPETDDDCGVTGRKGVNVVGVMTSGSDEELERELLVWLL